jgi:hypothetical protein
MPRGLKHFLLAGWLIAAPATVIASLFFYTKLDRHSVGLILGASDGPDARFSSPPPNLGGIRSSVKAGDARPFQIDKFLRANGSPMVGLGQYLVASADKNHIDWRLTTAIAYQESSLGRMLPGGSNNAWGWAIYTGQNSGATFHSWQFAIETVSQGLAHDYYAKGLRSPKQIEARYTPSSNGSWAAGVQSAMDEISNI